MPLVDPPRGKATALLMGNQQQQQPLPPPNAQQQQRLICLCCIPRSAKFRVTPPSSAYGSPILEMRHPQNRNGTKMLELSAAKLDVQKQRSRFFSHRHRSLSSQKKKSAKITIGHVTNKTSNGFPTLDLHSLAVDDTPSNTLDYLDCGMNANGREWTGTFWAANNDCDAPLGKAFPNGCVGSGGTEEVTANMETARTSRQEDIDQYPPMETLVDEILSIEEQNKPLPSLLRPESKRSARSNFRSPTSVAIATTASSANPEPNSPLLIRENNNSLHIVFPAQSTPNDADIERQQQQQMAVPRAQGLHPWRVGLPALAQSLFEVFTLAYFWIASSLVLLYEWLF